MRVYRGCRPQFVNTALDGIGAVRVPGRWHPKGVAIGYAAQHASLSVLEILVHLERSAAPADWRMLSFEIPDDAIDVLPEPEWPDGWKSLHYRPEVQAAGEAFVRRGKHLAMLVPSAIVPGERNILINPNHSRFAEIKRVEDIPLVWDARLFSQSCI